MKVMAIAIVLFSVSACKYTGTITPPPATACMSYAYTAIFTLPPGVTGTITGVSGFPASLVVALPSVSGTPTWADTAASPYTVTASGTVTSPVPWYKSSAWSGSTTVVVNPPPKIFAPATGFTIPAFTMLSNQVTISVAPTGTVPCPYTATYPNALGGLAQISVTNQWQSPQNSNPSDTVTLQLSREINAKYSGTLSVTLVPTRGGSNIVVNIPVIAL